MKFYESGLPNEKLVEDAFEYSYKNILSFMGEASQSFTQQIHQIYEMNVNMMEQQKFAMERQKAAGVLPEEVFKQFEEDYMLAKEGMPRQRDEQLKMVPHHARESLETTFRERRVAPALELLQHSEKTSPELLAAALLCETVRSPVDFQRLEKTFGAGIAGLVAEWNHTEAYPSERLTALAAAGPDAKRLHLVFLTASLDQTLKMAEKNPMMPLSFPPGQEEAIFSSAKQLWGNDKKLDNRLVDVFNRIAERAVSPYKMEINADGGPELIKSNLVPPANNPNLRPSFGPKPNMGDDAF